MSAASPAATPAARDSAFRRDEHLAARGTGRNRRDMGFHSIYEHGFARVAACTGRVAIADPSVNAELVLRSARECSAEGVLVALFPELTLTGYSLEDLVLQDAVLDDVE